MSTNHHHTSKRAGRRITGMIAAILLGPLAALSLAGPAAAIGSTPGSTAGSSSHWHCRLLPILC